MLTKNILGLDLSSKTLGICLLNVKTSEFTLEYISLKQIEQLHDKITRVIESLKNVLDASNNVSAIYLEDFLRGFKKGFTRQQDIILLASLNSVVQYVLRRDWSDIPLYLPHVRTARKTVLGQLHSDYKKLGFKNEKAFIFDWFQKTYNYQFPIKQKGPKAKKIEIIDESYDMVDSFIMAKHGSKQ